MRRSISIFPVLLSMTFGCAGTPSAQPRMASIDQTAPIDRDHQNAKSRLLASAKKSAHNTGEGIADVGVFVAYVAIFPVHFFMISNAYVEAEREGGILP